jgi:hypothetical protein
MNICSVELFLRKFLTGRGHFFLALAGSRLMPLINNWRYGSVNSLWGITMIFVCAAERVSVQMSVIDL